MHQRSSESSVGVAVGTSGTVVTGHGRSPGRNTYIHTWLALVGSSIVWQGREKECQWVTCMDM
jgi:hypothetical protein